jgi:glycosyltransferase A (GT-A) superfamily protein (DUF2064 family)
MLLQLLLLLLITATATAATAPAVMGYAEKGGYYLPPYNWWADAAAKNMVATVNKFYKNTGFSFRLAEV